jgi:hypothetical protein
MQASLELPDKVMRELEALAVAEGTTPDLLIRRPVTEHLQQHSSPSQVKKEVQLPLIPVAETGPIRSLSGTDLDDLFAREDLAS